MNRRVSPGEFVPGTFEQLLAELRNVPHVYQVLISNRSQTQFEVSVRIAECDVQSQLETRQQLAAAIRNDQLRSPGSAFESLGLRSSLDIGASELQTGGTTLFLGDSALDKETVIELARGYSEFGDLLRGRMGFDPVYEELGWYPKFVIDNRDLTNFLGFQPLHHPGQPWIAAPGREPPELHSVDPSTSDDTPQQPTPAATPQHTTSDTASQKEGGMTHQWWVVRTATVLRERGYDDDDVADAASRLLAGVVETQATGVAEAVRDRLLAVDPGSDEGPTAVAAVQALAVDAPEHAEHATRPLALDAIVDAAGGWDALDPTYLAASVQTNTGLAAGDPAALDGRTVVVTGAVDGYTRDDLHDALEAAGARAASSVSGNTDHLLVGADPGTSKREAALDEGVPMVDADAVAALD